MVHRWVEIVGEYFEDLYKCENCEMTVEGSDRHNWTNCDPEAF